MSETPEAFARRMLANVGRMTREEMADTLALLDELESRRRVELAQNDFLAFIAAMDTQYKFGAHLKRLGRLLMDVEEGSKDRIAVSMGPRFGKSQMISIYFPAWYIGKHPDHKMIVASHTADLAVDMARKVRNLMGTDEYKRIFPGVAIAADAKAAGKWNTTKGGEVFATGTGGAVAGRGAHLVIVDDPLSEQDIKAGIGGVEALDVVYEWFRAGLRTRLMPEGKICVLHCLVGGTRVLLADGSERLLKDIRPGDEVISYENGGFRPARVLNWASQGVDHVYTLTMRSGVIIRGNKRHPFLVNSDGVERWVKIRDLKPGMLLVSTTGVPAHPSPRPNPGYALPVRLVSGITENIPVPHNSRLGTTASGKGLLARLRGAVSLHMRRGFASLAGTRLTTPSERRKGLTIARTSGVMLISRCSMGSLALSTTECSLPSQAAVPYAESLLPAQTPRRNGKCGGWQSIIVTLLEKCGRYCATPATSSSRTATLQPCSERLLRTLSTTLDEIISITPDGQEEVFDIQVEGTENFVANGIVSHNTRWHQRDLIGRLVKDGAMNPDGDVYEVFEFPAILTVKNPAYEPGNPEQTDENGDFVPREIEKSLWPEQWSLESLLRTKSSMPAWQWNAQYQQNPTASEAALVKKEDIKWWDKPDPPDCDFIVQAYDTAMTTKERSDYSVCLTVGVFKDDKDVDNVIILNCVREKVEFPELKKLAREQAKDWEPDSIIVEAKASGQPLIDELRRSGLFVQDYSPGKGQDKIARMNSVSDMFRTGQVWFPETWWATEVVEELLAFPVGEHDDMVDALTLALIRVRKGGYVRLRTDSYDDEVRVTLPRRNVAYY